MFIGVRDDGTPEVGVNLERLQPSFTLKMQAAYSPIYFATKILGKDGSQFVAVIVPGSASRPHFAGPSYVRKGNRTETASEQQFDELLASRLSKSDEILKWMNKTITIDWMRVEHTHLLGAVVSSLVRQSKLSQPAIPLRYSCRSNWLSGQLDSASQS